MLAHLSADEDRHEASAEEHLNNLLDNREEARVVHADAAAEQLADTDDLRTREE